ncbi:hypothetical protein [Streptomyces sp. URMC 125]|uniref:hypothetical protein n=1 Tax=Streptomyces sp. URMC 125 TaxID=3423419 RepID=UPI003F1CC83C
MNIFTSSAGLSEQFNNETIALLEAIEVPLPESTGLALDVAFGTPLDMYEVGVLPHEQLDGPDIYAATEAIEARENRLAAVRDIAADQVVIALARERLDVLVPYAAQLRITPLPAAPVAQAEPTPAPAISLSADTPRTARPSSTSPPPTRSPRASPTAPPRSWPTEPVPPGPPRTRLPHPEPPRLGGAG